MRWIGRRTAGLGRVLTALLLVLLTAVTAAGASIALAAETTTGFRLVAHPSNGTGSLDRELLADAFLKKATSWPDGSAIEPVDLRFGSPVRERFSQRVLKRSAAAIRNYWQQRIFTGRGVPPAELASDAAVIRYVQTHRGAVGYVSEAAETSAVKIITVN